MGYFRACHSDYESSALGTALALTTPTTPFLTVVPVRPSLMDAPDPPEDESTDSFDGLSGDKPDPPHDDFPSDWETFWRGETAWARTDDGKEYELDAGDVDPQDGRCNAPLRDYERRYGEIRYCTQMPESTFVDDGSDYCRLHKSMDALMERADELFEHGYFASNYVNFAGKLSGEKFLFAVEMFEGLLELSQYDYEIEEEDRAIDTRDADFINEDEVPVSLPFPTNPLYKFQAQELWYAALKQIMQQNMKERVFDDGVSQQTIAQSADMEGKITDTITEGVEHHLHLPISRVTKDIKEHLKNGGVKIDAEDEGGVVTFQKNDYTLAVGEDDDEHTSQSEATETISGDEFAASIETDETAADVDIE